MTGFIKITRTIRTKAHHALLHSPRYPTGLLLISLLASSQVPKHQHQSILPAASLKSSQAEISRDTRNASLPSLSVMPTPLLLRSLMVTYILASPRLLSISLPLMDKMSSTNSWVFNPDKNPFLHKVMRMFFYDHFAAGENIAEVRAHIAAMKKMGFTGVVLAYYGKKSVGEHDNGAVGDTTTAIEQWRDGNLRTLDMLDEEDFLAMKFSNAGDEVVSAILSKSEPPAAFRSSIDQIVSAACAKKTRVWVDAEPHAYQGTIEAWVIDIMRQHNTAENCTRRGPPVYTTMQAYLKSTPQRIAEHIKLAHAEGWILGIKLARGAYLETEQRNLIYDTKAETDAAYDGIVRNLLTKTLPGIGKDAYPAIKLVVATHNDASVEKAYALEKKMIHAGVPTIGLEYGQLQGMSDELSCSLVKIGREVDEEYADEGLREKLRPKVLKYSVWGSVQQCMQFLVRRAVENRAAVERTKDWQAGLRKEAWRRVWSAFGVDR